MDYATAKQRLGNHANLPENGLPIEQSLVGSLWLADQGKAELRFREHAADVLACLQAANFERNGPDPDTGSGPPPNDHVVWEIAYFVSGIIANGIHYHRAWSRRKAFDAETLSELELVVHQIAHAWDQLLASDTTDRLEGFDATG